MVTENVKSLAVGLTGGSASIAVEQISQFDPEPINAAVSIVTQIVILVATLFGLFKKKPKTN